MEFLNNVNYKIGLAALLIILVVMMFFSSVPQPQQNIPIPTNSSLNTTDETPVEITPVGIRLIFRGNQSDLSYNDFKTAKEHFHAINQSFCGFLLYINETLPNDCQYVNKTFGNRTESVINCIWDNETDVGCDQ